MKQRSRDRQKWAAPVMQEPPPPAPDFTRKVASRHHESRSLYQTKPGLGGISKMDNLRSAISTPSAISLQQASSPQNSQERRIAKRSQT